MAAVRQRCCNWRNGLEQADFVGQLLRWRQLTWERPQNGVSPTISWAPTVLSQPERLITLSMFNYCLYFIPPPLFIIVRLKHVPYQSDMFLQLFQKCPMRILFSINFQRLFIFQPVFRFSTFSTKLILIDIDY